MKTSFAILCFIALIGCQSANRRATGSSYVETSYEVFSEAISFARAPRDTPKATIVRVELIVYPAGTTIGDVMLDVEIGDESFAQSFHFANFKDGVYRITDPHLSHDIHLEFVSSSEVRIGRMILKQRQPNQALQTTSVKRSGFGKISVSNRQRRGV